MASIFEKGEAMQERMFLVAAVSVSYCRDGIVLAGNIPAKLGKTLFRTDTSYGMTIRQDRRDFIVREVDIRTIGEPKKGDEIVYDGRTYMVAAPNDEPCWKWHTRTTHTQLRIHTQYAGESDYAE